MVGVASSDEYGFVPARWHLPSGRSQLFPQFQSIYAVNTHGWLSGSDTFGKASLLADKQIQLPGLVAHDDPFGDNATALSDGGRWIGGQAGA